MRFRVIVMPVAEGDIAGIIRYIADVLGNKNAALEHYDAFCRALESLEEMPDKNPISGLEVLNERGIRLIPVGNYVIMYSVLEDEGVTEGGSPLVKGRVAII